VRGKKEDFFTSENENDEKVERLEEIYLQELVKLWTAWK